MKREDMQRLHDSKQCTDNTRILFICRPADNKCWKGEKNTVSRF